MPSTLNALTSGNAAAGSGSSASVTPTANALVLGFILATNSDLTTIPDIAVPTSSGLTWIQVREDAGASGEASSLGIFRALGAAPGAGAISMTVVSASADALAWSFFELVSVDTSGTNGSGAVVQSATGSGISTTALATLGAFGSTNNATVGGCMADAAVTPGSGFTGIHSATANNGVFSKVLRTEWRNDNDTTVDFTFIASVWRASALEVKFSAPAATARPKFWTPTQAVQRGTW